MNEISYVDKNHPLKTKYVRNHTCPFFDDKLGTMKRSRRKFEKTFRKNGNSQAKSRFLNAVLEYFELFTKKKSEYLEKCVASENKRVRQSMQQQLLGKNNVVLPQSLGEPECLANKAFFVKKIEAVLVSIPPKNALESIGSHTTTLVSFQVFALSKLQLLLPKISNSTAPSDVIPTRLCKIVLTNSRDYFIALINLTLQTGYFPNQFKQGVVRPLIKNSNLDPGLSSYRPVTNLRFPSKVIEIQNFVRVKNSIFKL